MGPVLGLGPHVEQGQAGALAREGEMLWIVAYEAHVGCVDQLVSLARFLVRKGA